MEKKQIGIRRLLCLLLAFAVSFSMILPSFAEESYEESYEDEENPDEEETEFIPEEYYAPVESNALKDWPQGEAVQAASAVVMDLDTNAVLYGKNIYAKMYPASITKIMTCLVALEMGDPEEEITFSEIVYDLEEGSSHAGIQPGEKMTLWDALEGLMLESANDIGNGLAEHFSGSISAFAEEMTARAEALGCVNTHFTNPHGLHSENHYTCAYDMALIAQEAYKNPKFRELVSDTLYTCPKTNLTEEERYFVNHHKMLQEESDYYVNWCTGGKTGFTSDAWNTLVTYGEKDGKRLVCVLLHENGAGRAYLETTDLMNYGFDEFENLQADEDRKEISFYAAMKLDYPGKVFQAEELKQPVARITKPGYVTLPKGMKPEVLKRKAKADADGTETVTYYYEDWTVGQGQAVMTPLEFSYTLPFEEKLDMETILAGTSSRKSQNEIEATARTVLEQSQRFLQDGYEKGRDFVENNMLLVICVGSFLLLVLIILLIIVILRCTREARLQRKRRIEERERLRLEEEIDQKTTEEIEEELRAAMEEERQRREREAARIEQARIEEEKLHETERILEEINREEADEREKEREEKKEQTEGKERRERNEGREEKEE